MELQQCCRDYEGKHLFLGNAKEIPLKEMWYSNKLFNLRNMHMSGKREKSKICANCDVSTKLKN